MPISFFYSNKKIYRYKTGLLCVQHEHGRLCQQQQPQQRQQHRSVSVVVPRFLIDNMIKSFLSHYGMINWNACGISCYFELDPRVKPEGDREVSNADILLLNGGDHVRPECRCVPLKGLRTPPARGLFKSGTRKTERVVATAITAVVVFDDARTEINAESVSGT